MTGLITTQFDKTYIFRTDSASFEGIVAWEIYDDYDRAVVHKWKKFPKNSKIICFNIDNPPQTVRYIPLLN